MRRKASIVGIFDDDGLDQCLNETILSLLSTFSRTKYPLRGARTSKNEAFPPALVVHRGYGMDGLLSRNWLYYFMISEE